MKKHVLLCTHNGERYIAAQLQSILSQSSPVDAIHVFDFGSTDATRDIVNQLQSAHPHISLNCQPNAPGAALSFFTAMQCLAPQLADDDMVFLADQDDIWLTDKSQASIQAFHRRFAKAPNACLLLFHDVCIVDAELRRLQKNFYTGDPYAVPRDLTSTRVLLCNPIIGHTMAMSGRLLKIAASTSQKNAYLMHDWAITLVAMHCADIHYLTGGPYSLYRQHEQNVLGTARKHSLFQKIRRTRLFARNVLRQAQAFCTAAENLRVQGLIHVHPYPELQKLLKTQRHFQFIWYLSCMAFLTGPTLKRKMLGIFILFCGLSPQPTVR